MDAFTNAEVNNRIKAITAIKSILKSNWEFIETKPEDKTRFDFYIKNKETGEIIYIEHKDRKYSSNQFTDWQLDGKKYDYLKSLKEKCLYINTFTDGKYAIWDLSKNIGNRRWSTLHKKYTVKDSQEVYTYDIYFTLDEACKVGYYK